MHMRIRFAAASLLVAALNLPISADTAPSTLLEDFVHYALTAQVEMADANGQALLDSGLTPEELAELVDGLPTLRDRLPVAIRWAREVPSLSSIAGKLESRIERGRLDLAQSPKRIAEAIDMLDGGRRARTLARARLIEAGQYAVPPMLRSLQELQTPAEISLGVRNILPELGREAVLPLTTALPGLPADQQVVVINALADIGYPHAGTVLVAIARDDTSTEVVSAAAMRALRLLGWETPGAIDLADLHVQLATDYLDEMEHLRARPTLIDDGAGGTLEMQNIWQWDTHHGLRSHLVPTDLYWPTMAIREANLASDLAADGAAAKAAFVAGNLRLENRLGDRDVNLPLPQAERSPAFHATIHGPAVARDVLLMAIDQGDASMARDALAALSRTAGPRTLLDGLGDREAVTEALAFADQRVRYDAALVVAKAMPDQAFPGIGRVMPLLGSAIRGGGMKRAAIAGGDGAGRSAAAATLEQVGYTTGAEGDSWADAKTNGVGDSDLIVLVSEMDAVADASTMGVPVLLIVSDRELNEARAMTTGMTAVGVLRADAGVDAWDAVIGSFGMGQPLSESEQRAYTSDALAALRDLALSDVDSLNVNSAVPDLTIALDTSSGPQQLVVAETLSVIGTADAQGTLLDAAMKAGDEWQQISLLDLTAASVRRFGDLVSSRQADDLHKFVDSARGDVADAAARVVGALDRRQPVSAGMGGANGS